MEFNPSDWKPKELPVEPTTKEIITELSDKPTGLIKTWSFSTESSFSECPQKVYLSKVVGAPDPAGPAADRGTRIHDSIEKYITGESDELCDEAKKHFHYFINILRDEFKEGKVEVEGEWGHNRFWEPVANWQAEDLWLKLKLDALHWNSETSATVIDWKSGRKYGNELKHNMQLQIYTLCAFHRYPKLEHVKGMMVYTDKGELLEASYTRAEAMMFEADWHARGLKVTTATEFPATPGPGACYWCGHGKIQEGHDKPFCELRWTPE